MNKNLFRIIFNAKRGQRMAVAETAAGQGKGQGATCSRVKRALVATVLTVTLAACAFAAITLLSSAHAQIVADPSAPGNQRPTVLAAPNGVPLVNITTPSAAGVSINKVIQFDVHSNGVILNNSRTNVQTQLGGWVAANPWLAAGSASKIVTQVNSSNPTYLNGYVEVAGQRAEVIIANPSGIRVNGGGFINADRVTLTTGTPVINGGSLESYRVTGGTVAIEGLGLDTRTASYTDIIARAVEVNAGLWANYLKVTTGPNEVNAANTSATPIAGTGPQPNFMLDVAAIGGMYAGHIFIVGTEAGLGTRNAGAIGASVGEAVLLSNGWITNTGAIQAAGNLQINASGGITNTGPNAVISAQGDTSVTTGGSLANTAGATIAASGTLTATALGAIQNNQSTIAANGAVTMNAASLANESGSIASVASSLAITTTGATSNTIASGAAQGGSMGAAGDLSLNNAGLTNTGSSITGGNVTIDTGLGALSNTAGTISASGAASISSGALTNSAGLIQTTGGALGIDTHGQALDNTNAAGHSSGAGGIVAQSPLTLSTGDLDNSAGYIGASGAITATAAQVSNTAGGKIIGESSLSVAASGLNNQNGQVQALGDMALNVGTGTLNNSAGLIRSAQTATLNAGTLTNSNTAGSNQGIEGNNVVITATTVANNSGAIRADNNATLTSSGSLDNSAGLISAGNTATIQDTATVKTLAISNTGGTIIAGQTLTANAASLGGDGKLLSQQDLSIALTSDFSNTGEVIANRDATLTTLGDISNSGKLQAGRAFSATAQNINNTALGEISAVNTTVTAANTLSNRGLIDGVETRLNATTLNNIGTGRIYGDHLAIAATTLNNDTETVAGVRSDAVIAARERLDIGVQTLNNREHALVFSAGTGADALNIGGSLDASGQAIGQAGTVNNNSATIESLGGLTITAAQINNTNEHFSTQVVPVSSTAVTEFQGSGSGNRYLAGTPGLFIYNDESDHLATPEGNYETWLRYQYTRSISETVVVQSDPGNILSVGAMTLNADAVLNDKSRIIAGGALTGNIGTLTNTEAPGERIITDSGAVTSFWRNHKRGSDDTGSASAAYAPAATVQAISLAPTRFDANTAPAGSGTQVSVRAAAGTAQSTSAAGSAVANIQVLSINGPGSLPASSLFRVNANPAGRYLVETDPRFTNYRLWLGSDYMLAALGYDPIHVQKRLGDGFYEQKLIREQVAELTGRRFLADYRSDDEQYKALMDAGVSYARQYSLRPGIALSALQMAQLTSDIVWLVEQEFTLADGSKQKALVPQIYMRLQEGDLAPSGALLAGRSIDLNLTGDLTNAGTIAGRNVVRLTAQNIQNLGGRISGDAVSVAARDDLNNIGGQISAKTSLEALAGRDLNVVSTTSTQTGSQGSRTNISRVAGLYVSNPGGTLLASAGRDANIIAGVISNSGQGGSTTLTAGNNLNLGTVTEASNNTIVWNANNFRKDSQSQEIGTSIQTAGNLQLSAGNDLTARAASVQAQGTLTLSAGNDIKLLAGQNTQSLEENHQHTSKGFLSKKTTTTADTLESSTAQVTTLKGASVTVLAGNDAILEGTKITAQGDALVFAGNNVIAAAAHDSHSQSSSKETYKRGLSLSFGLIGAQIGTRGGGTATTKDTTTARGVQITSAQGNASLAATGTALLEGAQINAPQGTASVQGANVLIQAGVNTSRTSTTQTERGAKINAIGFSNPSEGIGRKLQETKGLEQTSLARSTLAGQNVNITATAGDARIAGTTVTTPGTLSLSAPNGQIALDDQQTETVSSLQSLGKDLMYQKMRDQGSIEQTTQYNLFNAGLVQINAPKITAQIGSKDSAQQLAQQPGMAWVGQLLNEPTLKDKIDWKTIEDASKSWDYKKQGLTPEGAVVVTIVAAFFTAGAAGTAGGSVATSAGLTTSTTVAGVTTTTLTTAGAIVAGATTAALTTLASQAAVSLINNQGDIGKVLEDLGSSENVKSLLTAMVTAGALQGMGLNPNVPGGDLAEKTFSSQLWPNLKAGVARSLISTAINGGSLEDSLKASITSAFIDTAAAQGAEWIGKNGPEGTKMLNAFTHKLAHAIAGCAAGAARSGSEGCAAGAIGAAVGEMAAEAYGKRADTAQFAGMIGAIAAAVAGGNAAQINLASQAGVNAAANNYLTDKQKDDKKKELAACQSALCKGGVNLKYLSIDAMQDAGLIIGVGGGIGYQSAEQAVAIVDLVKNLPETLTALSAIVTDPEFRAKVGNQIADDYKQRIDMQTRAYNDGGWDGSITAGVEAGRLAVDIVSAGAVALGAGKVIAVTAKAGVNAATAGVAMSANATVNFLENMALRNVQVGAINGFKSAEAVNATMKSVAGWEPSWQAATVVTDATLKPGSRMRMVVTEAEYKSIANTGDTSKLGGWATYDDVTSQAYARNQLAITPDMKANVGYVIEVEITRPIYAQIGVVGAQGGATGGGNQLHFVVPLSERGSVFKYVVNSGRALP